MVTRPFRCDPDRLRLLLEDRLAEDDQAELAGHLEECDGCRSALEALAAESRWWGEARRLADEPTPMGGHPPADPPGVWSSLLEPPDAPGHIGKVGPYEVVGLIGRGGMGVVLKAYDRPLGRYVAIKVLAPELATSATARRRFAREARAVAAIAHEHIVAVHSVDVTPAGLPFLVMHLVPGRSLQDRLDRSGPLEVREVLRIGRQAASGLAAAHAEGVVHRDVKPANILLENGVERVRLTDFGLARAADDASLTQSGAVAGTPQYMSPEQARGDAVDARADLFSLGSVLYALCTGRPPFRAETTMGVLRRVCEDTPRPIREINPEIPDWLEAIVRKLQAKEPADRFATAEEVAELLGRCLAYLESPGLEPPFRPSRPPSPRSRRRRTLAAASALAVLAAAAGLGASEASGVTKLSEIVATVLRIPTSQGTLVLKVDDPEVKVRVDGEEIVLSGAGPQEVRLSLRAGEHRVEKARAGIRAQELVTIARGGKQTVRVTRERAATPPGDADSQRSRIAARAEEHRRTEQDQSRLMEEALRRPSQQYDNVVGLASRPDRWPGRFSPGSFGSREARLPHRATSMGSMMRSRMAVSPENASASVRGSEVGADRVAPDAFGLFVVRDELVSATVPVRRGTLPGHRIWSLAIAPDGKSLAVGSGLPSEGLPGYGDDQGVLDLWDLDKGRAAGPNVASRYIRSVTFSPDGKWLATGEIDGSASLRDPRTGRILDRLEGHEAGVNGVAFSPDGQTLATAGLDGTVRTWDLASRQETRKLVGHEGSVYAVAYRPDGRALASGDDAHAIRLWDPATGATRAVIRGHQGPVEALAFSPDGKTLASASWDRTVRLWDAETGDSLAILRGHKEAVLGLAFSPDGSTLATAGGTWSLDEPGRGSGELRLWDVAKRTTKAILQGHTDRIFAVAFTPDGKTLGSASWDGDVLLWDLTAHSNAPPTWHR